MSEDQNLPNWMAELFRQAEYISQHAEPLVRDVWELAERLRQNQSIVQVIAALRQQATIVGGGSVVLGKASLSGVGTVTAQGVVHVSDSDYAHATETEQAAAAQAEVARAVGRRFVVALIWVFLVGAPVAAMKLPPEVQAIVATEYGAVALALAVAQLINQGDDKH